MIGGYKLKKKFYRLAGRPARRVGINKKHEQKIHVVHIRLLRCMKRLTKWYKLEINILGKV